MTHAPRPRTRVFLHGTLYGLLGAGVVGVPFITACSPPSPPDYGETESLQRFPTIEAPQEVMVGVEFTVQVSLTEARVTPEVGEEPGTFTLPRGRSPWSIDVVLSGSGFAFRSGKNADCIELPRTGDSSIALFHLTALDQGDSQRPVWVTFYYDSRFLFRARRPISVGKGGAVEIPAPVVRASDARAELRLLPGPDLTVEIVGGLVRARGRGLQQMQQSYTRPEGLTDFLAERYARLAAIAGRGVEAVDSEGAHYTVRGIGRELYQRFAPDVFKEAFWFQVDRLGDRFESIQIYSDDPLLPWELMVPRRKDASEERGYLGLEFSISRWHAHQDGRAVASPPPSLDLEELMLIVPAYDPPLAAVAQEVAAIHVFDRAVDRLLSPVRLREVRGRVSDVGDALKILPRGILHLAGHGVVLDDAATGTAYSILLEDDRELTLDQFRGMLAPDQPNHPFIFFNACDIGRAQRTLDFVDGWAPVMLDAGASAYLGALWPVSDAKAARFSEQFYASLAAAMQRPRGGSVLDAVRDARALFERSGDPTYLAYVYYGDPELRVGDHGAGQSP